MKEKVEAMKEMTVNGRVIVTAALKPKSVKVE